MKVIIKGLNTFEFDNVAGVLERKHGGKDSIRVIFDTDEHQEIPSLESDIYTVEVYNNDILSFQYDGNWRFISYIYDGGSGLDSYHQLIFLKE